MILRAGLMAIPLALVAQAALDHKFAKTGWVLGAVVFACAGIAFAVSFNSVKLTCQSRGSSQWHDPQPLGDRWLLLGISLAWIAFFVLLPNQFTLLGTVAWIGAIVSTVWLATGPVSRDQVRFLAARGFSRIPASDLKRIGTLVAITLLAAVFRFYRLDSLPAEMGLDPPYIYLGSQSILNGDRPIFITLFPGQESGFFYLVAALSRFLVLSFFTLKAASALIGTVTVAALLLLGRRLFCETVAVVAATLLAVNGLSV